MVVALVDTLVIKTRAWEEEHGLSFTYDGVPLLAMLDEYALLRHDREEDKRRMRVRKRIRSLSLFFLYRNYIFSTTFFHSLAFILLYM